MEDLEVRELRYFVAVADELNFTRAATRLGMAQPPLSRAIRRIERKLGVQLFHRDTHRVTLTAAGSTLLAEARTALDVISTVARRTQRAALPTPTLVATAKPGRPSQILRQIVDTFALSRPVPQVEILVSGYGEQANLVRDGRADVALLGSPYEHRELETEQLVAEPRVVALPTGHRLAGSRRLRCGDLMHEPIPRWTQSDPAEREYWAGRDIPRPGGDPMPPVVGPAVSDIAQMLEVVSLGQAVALVPQSVAAAHPRPDIRYRPVVDASPYVIAIGWRAGSRAPAVAQFVSAAIELFARPKPM
ncbi:MAG TPA: LysR substrate-binding domain-containing protein [Candidatus Limnocylindrales bacterium]